jgi:hypothetical protein
MNLAKKKTKFITASHLYAISQFEEIRTLCNVKFVHMKINFVMNSVNNCTEMVLDRKLYDGLCSKESELYGVEVAECIVHDSQFIKDAYKIRNKLTSKSSLDSIKVSRYNPDVVVSHCEICKSVNMLETHHIVHQKTADSNNFVVLNSGIKVNKNIKSNLVVLCNLCHDLTHSGSLCITGWENDVYGTTLKIENFKVIIKNIKFTDEQYSLIMSLKGKYSKKKIILLLRSHGISVSIATLNRMYEL